MVRVVIGGSVHVGDVGSKVCGERQTLEYSHGVAVSSDDGIGADTGVVAEDLIAVVIEVSDNVEVGCLGTAVLTVVVLFVAELVKQVGTAVVFQVDRIDRSHELSCIPCVTGLGVRVLRAVLVSVRIACAGTEFHPVVNRVVNVGAEGITLELGCDEDTLVVKITERERILCLMRSTADTKLILLADSLVFREDIHPVVVPGGNRVGANPSCLRIDEVSPLVILERIVELSTECSGKTRGRKSFSFGEVVATVDDVIVLEGFPSEFHELFLVDGVIVPD